MNQHLSRRLFFRKCIPAGVLFGMVSLVGGCASGDNKGTESEPSAARQDTGRHPAAEGNASADPCTGYSGLSQDDLKARSAMGYTTQSPVEEKQCGNCQLYLPPPQGTACGRCQLFKGPVTGAGYCTYWAPQG